MTGSAGLAMSWDQWYRHDAVALAGLVRSGQLTAKELAAQVAAGVAQLDRQIEAVLGLYDDVLADPDKDAPDRQGRLYGVPMFLKDLGSGLAGRAQEAGSKLFKGHVVPATDPLIDNYLRSAVWWG
jgi:amidase